MANPEDHRRITAIVPAYNEASRIAAVLAVLTSYPKFREVIVVDDGSTDGTAAIARGFNVRYVSNGRNRGKGHSMDHGVSLARGDIIFFCDADITGLNHGIIDEIVDPVLQGEVDMFIGMRNRKWYFVHQVVALVPLLGGERAITKDLWHKLPAYYKQYFRIEAALNFYALYHGDGFQYKVFRGLSQVIKEKKYGLWDGTRQRWGMMYNIFAAQFRLHIAHIPKSVMRRRSNKTLGFLSAGGMLLGVLFLVAAYLGPASLVRAVFADDLVGGAATSFTHSLLSLSSATDSGTVAVAGVLVLLLSTIAFLFSYSRLNCLPYGFVYKFKSNKS